jgi:hypothetical protein
MGLSSRWPSAIYLLLLILVVFHQYTIADIYFHVPRGSNNRLLGERANRQNAKRVFNSQVCYVHKNVLTQEFIRRSAWPGIDNVSELI